VAWRLGEANIAWDDGLQHVVSEELAEVGGNLACKVGPVVKHGEEDAFNGYGMTERFTDAVDGIHEFRHSFKGEELALDGHQCRIGSHKGVEGEEIQCWGAIDQDVLIVILQGLEVVSEDGFAVIHVDQFKVDSDEVFIGRDQVQTFNVSVADAVIDISISDENIPCRVHSGNFLDAETAGCIALRVAVDQQYFDFAHRERGGEVDGCRGFTDATFLVGYGYGFAQRFTLRSSGAWGSTGASMRHSNTICL